MSKEIQYCLMRAQEIKYKFQMAPMDNISVRHKYLKGMYSLLNQICRLDADDNTIKISHNQFLQMEEQVEAKTYGMHGRHSEEWTQKDMDEVRDVRLNPHPPKGLSRKTIQEAIKETKKTSSEQQTKEVDKKYFSSPEFLSKYGIIKERNEK